MHYKLSSNLYPEAHAIQLPFPGPVQVRQDSWQLKQYPLLSYWLSSHSGA